MVSISEALIERVVHHDPRNGFTVLLALIPGREQTVRLVGTLPKVFNGECLSLEGEWQWHQVYGEQFAINRAIPTLPSSLGGVVRFLSSAVPGLGTRLALKITDLFGADTLRVLNEEPHKLHRVKGLGDERVKAIIRAWKHHVRDRETLIALASYGVSDKLALAIIRALGDDALSQFKTDPYVLSAFVGFEQTDRYARRMGAPLESPHRCQAGILELLHRHHRLGHTALQFITLVSQATALLGVPEYVVLHATLEAAEKGLVVLISDGREVDDAPAEGDCMVQDAAFFWAEDTIRRVLHKLLIAPPVVSEDQAVDIARRTASLLRIDLAPEQEQAVVTALRSHVCLITGGPGVGKSTVTRVIVHALMGMPFGAHVVCGAPTGKASIRLARATGEEAYTIHRLIGYRQSHTDFEGEGLISTLAADALLIDECGMVDSLLLAETLSNLTSCFGDMPRVILVGDVEQLPPIAPGPLSGICWMLSLQFASKRCFGRQLAHRGLQMRIAS